MAHVVRFHQLSPVRDAHGMRKLREELAQHLRDQPEALRRELAMVASELAENGLRHAKPAGAAACVVVELHHEESFVELSVTTQLEQPEAAHEVLRRLDRIACSPDNERAYEERLLELSRATNNPSGELGFLRIATEGRCTLEAVHEGDRLTIRARRAL